MNSKFKCNECDKEFARKFTLKRHMASMHHDGHESSVEDSQEEEDSNASEINSPHETDMENDEVAVWKYYADVAWKNASEETNSMLQSIEDASGISERRKKEWLKTMDKHFIDA